MKKNIFGKFAMAGLVAGAFAISACEDDTTSATQTKDEALLSAKTAESFTEECTKLKGTAMGADCKGKNTCEGYYFVVGATKVEKHTCEGKGSCAGTKCVVPK